MSASLFFVVSTLGLEVFPLSFLQLDFHEDEICSKLVFD